MANLGYPDQPPGAFAPVMPPPRISGTAMPTGVFLSSGAEGTAAPWELALTGVAILALGSLSMLPVYCVAWLVEQHWPIPLTATLLQVGGSADPLVAALARVAINLLTFICFLTILRMSPLAGYHAAEHMTVHAIEHYGPADWEAHVQEMPRAHRRCGSNLLAGVLPALLIGAPLLTIAPWLSLVVAVLGWGQRHRIGFALQNVFTTRPPTSRQLAAGIDAGRRVLAAWATTPPTPTSAARRLWLRGVPQLVAGAVLGSWAIGAIANSLHVWLDW